VDHNLDYFEYVFPIIVQFWEVIIRGVSGSLKSLHEILETRYADMQICRYADMQMDS
jgi:hypothetical protein